MRSNGLTAPSYTPVADLDPVLATTMLDDLRAKGVAAYTKPVEPPSTLGFDQPGFGLGVRDRLYVDAAASSQVRDFLSARDPGLLVGNDDLTWAQIVAGFDRPLDAGVTPWPVQEDLASDEVRGGDDSGSSVPGDVAGDVVLPIADRRNRAGDPPRRRAGDIAPDSTSERLHDDPAPPHTEAFDDADFLASTSKTAASDEEDRFVPDPPPPLPTLAPHKKVAWLGVLGGPLLLLVAVLLGLRLPDWLAFLGVVGFIVGFITLVVTMGENDEDDWRSDNGAVV